MFSKKLWYGQLGIIFCVLLFACDKEAINNTSPLEQIQKERAAFAAFLAENKRTPGVVAVSDSLQYKVIEKAESSTQMLVSLEDTIRVLYSGLLLNGTIFDSTKKGDTFQTSLKGVILGWQRILPLMKVGDFWRVFMNADLAYGDRGAGNIPGGAGLIFDIRLVGIRPHKAQ